MLTEIIAQAVPPDGVESWLKAFFWLVGGCLGLVLLVKQFAAPKSSPVTVSPQPLIVRPDSNYATREELQRAEQELKEDLTKQAAARKKMHEEIGELQSDVRALQTTADHQTRSLHVLDGKIDRILERLPRS